MARYAHTLSILKKQADRSAVTLGADVDSVVHTIAHQPSAPSPAALASSSAKTDAAQVAALSALQRDVLAGLFRGHTPSAIAQNLDQPPETIVRIIDTLYADLGATGGQVEGLAAFEHSHRGGLTQLYLDVKAAQKTSNSGLASTGAGATTPRER